MNGKNWMCQCSKQKANTMKFKCSIISKSLLNRPLRLCSTQKIALFTLFEINLFESHLQQQWVGSYKAIDRLRSLVRCALHMKDDKDAYITGIMRSKSKQKWIKESCVKWNFGVLRVARITFDWRVYVDSISLNLER